MHAELPPRSLNEGALSGKTSLVQPYNEAVRGKNRPPRGAFSGKNPCSAAPAGTAFTLEFTDGPPAIATGSPAGSGDGDNTGGQNCLSLEAVPHSLYFLVARILDLGGNAESLIAE